MYFEYYNDLANKSPEFPFLENLAFYPKLVFVLECFLSV